MLLLLDFYFNFKGVLLNMQGKKPDLFGLVHDVQSGDCGCDGPVAAWTELQ